jgi:hypothetical protein
LKDRFFVPIGFKVEVLIAILDDTDAAYILIKHLTQSFLSSKLENKEGSLLNPNLQ